MTTYSLIVAMDNNSTIGRENSLPWSLPKDLRHFKKITTGHTVVMGRKTFESIGKPLANRKNIVVSRDASLTIEGCTVLHSIEEVLEQTKNEEEVFIIGGKELYLLFFPYIDKCYITRIYEEFEGDTTLLLDLSSFQELSSEIGEKDAKNPYDFTFFTYQRI